MKRSSLTRVFKRGALATAIAVVLLAMLNISARGGDDSPGKLPDARPSAIEDPKNAAPPDSRRPSAPDAGAQPVRSASSPSLEDVMELLQAQGRELETLRTALREQQELTARLAAKLVSSSVESVANESNPEPLDATLTSPSTTVPQEALEQKVTRLESEVRNSRKAVEEKLKALGPFVFSGDLRLRAEPTFGGPGDQSQDRFRERIRFRFNAEAQLNDQFRGGFSLASGDLNNPISTNQTLNQYTTRKPIAIDRAYATYNPAWFRSLTLTGGKFAYPWFNTELVWDKDLNPEGAEETLAFNVRTPLLKKFSVVGFQLPFAENKRANAADKSFYNTMVYGEQLQTFWQLGSRVKLSA